MTMAGSDPRGVAADSDQVLDALEAEALWVMRETAGAFRRPVLLYSIGKDFSVLLHLARKAFHPGPIPFPLLHVDSTWEFQEMIAHRDRMAAEVGATLIVGINEEGVAEGITPLTHGVQEYTRLMRTVPLLRSLDEGEFDAAMGGGRRDEERSRSKERIFSLREPGHRWEPRKQRPEFWRTPNTSLNEGQTMRVFPISNWTELDVWRYIRREKIPVVDLYFARERLIIERRGALLMLDDDRMPVESGESPRMRKVRFRTLGCYPLTGAVESEAGTLDDLIREMETAKESERAGRLIDGEKGDSMEAKKRAGYF